MRRRLPLIEDAFDRRQVLLLGAAATVAACGGTVTDGLLDGDGAVADDTGDPGVEDAGSPVADAGRRPTDSGVFSRDAVTPNPDAGVPTHDAGSPVVDAGGGCSVPQNCVYDTQAQHWACSQQSCCPP